MQRPPECGIKPAKGTTEPQERRRAKGVESDTVTRVTHGRPRVGYVHGTETTISFDAERNPTRPRDPTAGSGTPADGTAPAHDPRRARRVRCSGASENGGASRSKRAASICATVGRANSVRRTKTAGTSRTSPVRGCTVRRAWHPGCRTRRGIPAECRPRAPRGEGGGASSQRRSGTGRASGIARHNNRDVAGER